MPQEDTVVNQPQQEAPERVHVQQPAAPAQHEGRRLELHGRQQQRTSGPSRQPAKTPAISMGINVQKPRYPEYAILSNRLQSFGDNWPDRLDLSPADMAACGFYYAGLCLVNCPSFVVLHF